MLFDNDKLKKIFIVFSCVGLLLFLIGAIISVKTIFFDVKGKETTYAEVIDLGEDYTVAKYKVNGKEYERRYSAYSSTYYKGKKIKIYYDKNHPQKSFIANLRYLVLIAPGMGILFTGVGGIGLLVCYFKSDKYKTLGY